MKIATPVAVSFALLAACGTERSPAPTSSASVKVTAPDPRYVKHVAQAASLERFTDCNAVTKTLRTEALRYVGPYGLPGNGPVTYATAEGVASDKMAAAAPAAAAPQAGVDYSTTNVQEQGVDEPDLTQTDGRRIFAVANATLHAAVIDGDTPRLVGALHLNSGDAQLLLEGDRLIVVGSDTTTSGGPVEPMGKGLAMLTPIAYSEKTLVQVVDVSNPSAMRVTATLHLHGTYISARAVKGIVRIVVRNSSPNIAFATPSDPGPATTQRALDTNRSIVSSAGIDKWIPRYSLSTPKGASSGPLSSCSTTYAPQVFSGLSTVTVVTVDRADPTPRDGSTVVGGGETVYASRDALYVTEQKWDQPIPYAVSKDGGVSAPAIVVPANTAETQIHKFDITGRTARYLASGIVKGTVLNSYALSELDGVLRIATTTNGYRSSSSSSVTTFGQHGTTLVPLGSVGGLGAGEQIRGVRFIGNAAYVVTFRQTDPLYVVDLSHPSAPKVVGELKIPGFSAYLHPVGDSLLLGIGEVADAQGHVHDDQGHWFGTKVSLFDVHDPAHPTEIATHVVPGGQSAVEQEPHAFLWWAPRKLAVIPISSYDASSFHGAVGMHVDPTISEVGRIPDPDTTPQGFYDPGIQRTFVVGDRVYALSATGLGSYDIASLARRAWLGF
jgi:uncharacterized secreted protein with C-terminal beta-propeller domain